MSLIGKSLAHYEITSQIGKGGMGEVYHAKDQKLGRDVAIKVLPEEFARDADRVARFQREAKLLASLNHPNIAAIYGLEEYAGTHFLVMELVEGNTLDDRIKAGAVPVEEALKLALQIAEALEAAHDKGVIHRDLKPANIKVTPDGKVKVLDFGLAKAFAAEQADLNLSNSPTLSDAATQQGVILGTAAYMSPEQARGKPVDKRTDVWAFGVVLYEMLTGRAAFLGKDVTDTLAAVIRSEPDWNSLPANLHWRLKELLERCLEKEAKDRYSSISDARVDIQKVLADPSGVFAQPSLTTKPRKKLRVGIPWVAAAIVVAGIAVWLLKPAPPPEPKQVVRFDYDLPEGQQLVESATDHRLAVSPDGSHFVYGTSEGLYIRSINTLNARLISGTDKDSSYPFFSPDSQWIGYFSRSDQKLKKVGVSGGAPVVLCTVSELTGDPNWDSDDTILYNDLQSGIMKVSAIGGTPETLIKGSIADLTGDGIPVFPQMLPDGKTLLFTKLISANPVDYKIVVQSLQSGEQTVLFTGGLRARYLPTGHIVYALPDNDTLNLLAVPFDLAKLELTGGSVSILEGVGGFAVSDSGMMIYVPQPETTTGSESGTGPQRTLVWVDRKGKEEPLGAEPAAYSYPKISPDGTKVAWGKIDAGNQDIWIWDIPHKTPTRLTFHEGSEQVPIWTPDGNRIVFNSERNGPLGDVYWKSADGIGAAEPLFSTPTEAIFPWSFTKDGKILALSSLAPLGMNIQMLSMEGNKEVRKLLQEEYMEAEPQISPDGRYVAYQSDESGKGQVYVRLFPDVTKGKWQISNDGGNSPLWSPDGRELYFRNGDATMAIEIETEPTFKKRGNPKILFRGNYTTNARANIRVTYWDIHPDGDKFLMIKPPAAPKSTTEEPAPAQQPKIIVVLNWFEELKDRVPVD